MEPHGHLDGLLVVTSHPPDAATMASPTRTATTDRARLVTAGRLRLLLVKVHLPVEHLPGDVVHATIDPVVIAVADDTNVEDW